EQSLAGAWGATLLVLDSIKIIDTKLYQHLNHPKLHPFAYLFSPVSSLLAIATPIMEVIRLWDFLMAFGIHMIVPCIVGQILLLRESILNTDPLSIPVKILNQRKWPKIDSKKIISTVMNHVIPKL